MNSSSDFVVIGGGIVGLSIARAVKSRWVDAKVLVLEKEQDSVRHGSGRNSGVLHAGFYYSPDSLKARLTRDGNRLLKEFCSERRLPIRECGKVVVTTHEGQLEALDELYRRGIANGVDLELIDENQLSILEPMARTHHRALWSPNTAVADPSVVTQTMAEAALAEGVVIRYGETVLSTDGSSITTNRETMTAGHIINAAGLYADKVAEKSGFADDFVMLPFIGLYAYAPSLKGRLTRHVYPVPDPRNPFLGVHATVTVDGSVKIGPTAIPALSREAYRALRDIDIRELSEILQTFPKFLLSPHHNVGSLLRTELPKYSRSWLVHEARKLVPDLRRRHFTVKGRPGIRAQLFDLKNRRLEMDFVVRGDHHSTHVLNAVSPAWTGSFAFAKYVVDDIENRLQSR